MPRTTLNISETKYANYDFVERRIIDDSIAYEVHESNPASAVVESRVTVNTPGFKKRRGKLVDRPDLPINPFTYNLRRSHNPYGTMDFSWPAYGLHGSKRGAIASYGTNFEPTQINDGVRSVIDSEALAKLYANAKESTVNLGIMFAERKQTSDLILSTAKSLADGLRDMRRGNPRTLGKFLGVDPRKVSKGSSLPLSPKEMAKRWLELQFGWTPLYNDMYGALESLAKARDRVWRTKIAATATFRKQTSHHNESWDGVPLRRSENAIYARKYVVYVSVSHEGRKSLSELGITNPLSVLWEIVPWSFAIDWFLPVGRFLDSLDAFSGLEFEKGSNTSFERTDVRYRAQTTVGAFGGYTRVSATAGKLHVDVNRSVLNGLPAFPLPYFRPNFSDTRAVTALALIRQRLK